jgi:MATE family, multidrug efflux pump
MLTNAIGLQGMVDHALVGNLVGYQANAAIGVAWQIFLMVIIFITSLFTGMSVLVARFVGTGEEEKVNRTVYQAFLTAIFISLGIMAPIGYAASPFLLDLVNAAPNVKAEALPFLRIMFVFSSGMMIFFMLGGALRSAGDARTPLVLGVVMTILNLVLNVILIADSGRYLHSARRARRWERASLRELWLCMHSLSCGAEVGSCRFRAKASVRIGASFARFFDSACRPAFRESR